MASSLRPAALTARNVTERLSHRQPLSSQCLRAPRSTYTSPPARRHISTTLQRGALKPIEQAKTQHRMGPTTLYSGLFFIVCGGGVAYYFQSEKARMLRKRTRDASKGYGKPRIGGDYDLIDQNGKRFTSEDMKGKFALMYFGFSHCPDICPDELDKMAKMIDMIHQKRGNVVRPIVVTCDPARDSPAVLKQYLSEFHEDMIGLTGTWDEIKAMCKAYRVYFSTPPHVKPGQDYLVDHSIYFYLMDPDGDFIEVIGREHTAEKGAKLATDHIGDWEDKFIGRSVTAESWTEDKQVVLEKVLQKRSGKYKPNLE